MTSRRARAWPALPAGAQAGRFPAGRLESGDLERRGVAIDLDTLVVLDDETVGPDEESLLDRLFPQSFYVVGTEGNYLTTMNNLDLFHRVLEMIDKDTNLDAAEFREEVTAMLEDADPLSQEAVRRGGRERGRGPRRGLRRRGRGRPRPLSAYSVP